MKAYLNPDGRTYNAVAMFADLTGLSQAEVKWTFNRIKHLMHHEHKTKEEAKAIVKAEAKSRPWEAQS